jgi:competence protein ComEC
MRELRTPSIAGLVTITLLALYVFLVSPTSADDKGLLRVSFLDVGQGDATLIESPSGTQVLIDGGKGGSVLRELGRTLGFFDRDIDMIVATHPDMDHIGGLIDVLTRYHVGTILMTENESGTPAFESFRRLVEEEGADILYARRGQVFELGEGERGAVTLTILFPDHDPTDFESNTSSIVARLTYGESEFMLTGDSPREIEEYLAHLDGISLKSDVLKLGHHGSRTSTSPVFLEWVGPSYAIISAGKDNSYGHPHPEVMELLAGFGITQKNTADESSIFSYSDGVRIWFR